jgi:hypothetical protein
LSGASYWRALPELAAAAVGRRARGIEELHFLIDAPVEQDQRIAEVVLHHVAAVGFHGVRAGAFMENGVDRRRRNAGQQALDEFVLVEVIGDFAIDQIRNLSAASGCRPR